MGTLPSIRFVSIASIICLGSACSTGEDDGGDESAFATLGSDGASSTGEGDGETTAEPGETGDGDGDGSKFDVGTDPDGSPKTPCEQAAAARSNLGCEFWAVDMGNYKPKALFGIAVSNPSHDAPVRMRVYDARDGAETLLVEREIQARQVEQVALSGDGNDLDGYYPKDAGVWGSEIGEGMAFRIVTDLPVVAAQFNPMSLANETTGDASLLLPTPSLGVDYLSMAYDVGHGVGSELVVVASEDDTVVSITPRDPTEAGDTLPALVPGVENHIELDRYDFAQLTTRPKLINIESGWDLTGARIRSNKPVAVFSGHACADVPDDSTNACDHLEEQIFPLETWGEHYIAARNPPRQSEKMLWRILGSVDGTTVEFDPPVPVGASAQVDAGETLQFQASGDFEIESDHPVLVAGFMLGGGKAGGMGDPYMVQMVPVEQFQTDYVFLVDSSYMKDVVKYIRPAGAPIQVPCLGTIPENRWSPVGSGDFETAVVTFNPGEADCTIGTNESHSDHPFGIIISGESYFASYAYPGGGGLLEINPPQG